MVRIASAAMATRYLRRDLREYQRMGLCMLTGLPDPNWARDKRISLVRKWQEKRKRQRETKAVEAEALH